MKKLLNSRAFIAIITALAFGSLGYYMGSQSNSMIANHTRPTPLEDIDNTTEPTDTINCDTAYKWINNFGIFAGKLALQLKDSSQTNLNILPTNSLVMGAGWTLPLNNLLYAFPNNDTNYVVRAYLALKDYPDKFDPHLVLAVVQNLGSECNEAGNDIIMEHYFDLVRPCPNLCDVNSKLYQNFLCGVKKHLPSYTPPCTPTVTFKCP